MKLRVVQTDEVERKMVKQITVDVTLEFGEAYPVGFGSIVLCHDGTLFNYEGKKDFKVEVEPGVFESMLLLDGVSLEGPFRVGLGKGQCLELVVPTREKYAVVRQKITLI